MLKLALGFLAALILITPASATSSSTPGFIKNSIPEAKLVGQAHLTYMTFTIYNADLYAPKGKLIAERPLALKLTYLRNLRGNTIADRSIEEIRHQGFNNEVILAAWHDKMLDIFPDVKSGTELTGVLNKTGTTIFYKDGKEIGRISDPSFSKWFFSIWLGSKTSEPEMRKNLLNLKG